MLRSKKMVLFMPGVSGTGLLSVEVFGAQGVEDCGISFF